MQAFLAGTAEAINDTGSFLMESDIKFDTFMISLKQIFEDVKETKLPNPVEKRPTHSKNPHAVMMPNVVPIVKQETKHRVTRTKNREAVHLVGNTTFCVKTIGDSCVEQSSVDAKMNPERVVCNQETTRGHRGTRSTSRSVALSCRNTAIFKENKPKTSVQHQSNVEAEKNTKQHNRSPEPIITQETIWGQRETRSRSRGVAQMYRNNSICKAIKSKTNVQHKSNVEAVNNMEQLCRSPKPKPSAAILKNSMQTMHPSNGRIRRTCASRVNSSSPSTASDAKITTAVPKNPNSSKLIPRLVSAGQNKNPLGNRLAVKHWDLPVTLNEWTKSPGLEQRMRYQSYIKNEHIIPLFSLREVDLRELFPNICKSQLVRNSSVFWQSPE